MKKNWFTLIEMLIAITVFAIWVLAVFRVITWNLKIMDDTEMKLQATILAREWMELLYNVRDSNLEKELGWNCVLSGDVYRKEQEDLSYSDICVGYFGTGKYLQLSFDKNNYIEQKLVDKKNSFDELFSTNRLCYYTGENIAWYGTCPQISTNNMASYFARYLSFSPVDFSASPNAQKTPQSLSYDDKILKVESHVLYKKWWKTWEVVFESFIWNY